MKIKILQTAPAVSSQSHHSHESTDWLNQAETLEFWQNHTSSAPSLSFIYITILTYVQKQSKQLA